jgi:hypothetical protein
MPSNLCRSSQVQHDPTASPASIMDSVDSHGLIISSCHFDLDDLAITVGARSESRQMYKLSAVR